MAKYIVDGTLNHDGVTYEHGAEFETDDEQLASALRKATTLKLPSELLPAEDVQSELERLRAENAALKAGQQGDAGEPPKSGETSTGEE